jgi:AhpD family alkylhydroperoxidase
MYAANAYFDGCSIRQKLRRLMELRASQINHCTYCMWLHSRQARELGETEERVAASSAGARARVSAIPSGQRCGPSLSPALSAGHPPMLPLLNCDGISTIVRSSKLPPSSPI